MIGPVIPFVGYTPDQLRLRCYVCHGPDDFAVRDQAENLRAVLCARHEYLAQSVGLTVRDRRLSQISEA